MKTFLLSFVMAATALTAPAQLHPIVRPDGRSLTLSECCAYSGEGLYLLQLLVETLRGKPLDMLAQEQIFSPFGMRRTSYLWQPAFDGEAIYTELFDKLSGITIPWKWEGYAP